MLLGVLSDTHGNVEAIQDVTDRFMKADVDLVLHLGDDYLDMFIFGGRQIKSFGSSGIILSGISGSDHSEPTYRKPGWSQNNDDAQPGSQQV